MDSQHHTTHTTPSGHEGHSVHLCHRCGWPFPKPHPSAKHRRAHKKICGTIEGYTHLIGSEVVSDDEHHPDDDKEKTPSPKIDKKMSMESDGEIKGSFSRSEEEFTDAVTEFADSGASTGSANKALDRDVFFSFKDAENADANEVSNAPVVDTSIEASEKIDPHVETIEKTEITAVGDSSESNLELTKAGDLVEDGVVGPGPEPSDVSQSPEGKSIDVMEAGVEKGQESQTSETITEEAKDSEVTNMTPEVSATVSGHHDNVKQENLEKLESVTIDGISEEIQQDIKDSEITKMTPEVSANVNGDHDIVKQETFEKLESVTTDVTSEEIKQEIRSDCEHVLEAVKESETVEEIKIGKSELDHELDPEVVKGSEMDHLWGTEEEIKHEKIESDHKHVIEVAKESEADQNASVLNEKDLNAPNEHIQEIVKEPVAVLTEKTDLEAPESEKSSREPIQEAGEEPVAVLIEREDVGGSQLEQQSIENTHEVVETTDAVLTEKDLGTPESEGSSKEQIQEAVMEPDTVLTEKEDLGGPHIEKESNEHAHEVVEEPYSVLTEKQDLGAAELEKCTKENVVEEPGSVLTNKEDLDAHKAEECSKDEVVEQKVILDRDLVADVSTETDTLKDSSDNSSFNNKNASEVVPEPIVEEGNGKLMNNQDLTVDSSSHNSLEGNWGSVSVLSTASIDAETLQSTEKSKVNSGKSNAATADVYEPPSFMTLVEPESKDQKSGSAELQDSQSQPNSEPSQAGWFPTLTKVNNESEGRKKNEEAMAKVTNWDTGKQSTPLKNLLGEARSPSGKQPEPVVQKDEATVNPPVKPMVNDEVSSPPKLIEDGKNGRKKVKGRSSWVPFVCCSSVNVK